MSVPPDHLTGTKCRRSLSRAWLSIVEQIAQDVLRHRDIVQLPKQILHPRYHFTELVELAATEQRREKFRAVAQLLEADPQLVAGDGGHGREMAAGLGPPAGGRLRGNGGGKAHPAR